MGQRGAITLLASAAIRGRVPQVKLPAMPALPASKPAGRHSRLTEEDAIEIWIARWLRSRRRDLCERYGCDPRRLYEIWEGLKFPASREKAEAELARRYPTLAGSIDTSRHRRIPRRPELADQLSLF